MVEPIGLDEGVPVDLRVRVADAQGLRLRRGGEIRLVITLRAADDPGGEAFGAKVTPWLQVPEIGSPEWRAREAVFSVPPDRCFEAQFVDSAHLHLELVQKGRTPPSGTPVPAAPPAAASAATSAATSGALGGGLAGALAGGLPSLPSLPNAGQGGLGVGDRWSALRQNAAGAFLAARQGAAGAASALPIGWPLGAAAAAAERGELVGALRVLVGKRLVCPDGRADLEEGAWTQLLGPGPSREVKGALFLELAAARRGGGKAPAPALAPALAAHTSAAALASADPATAPAAQAPAAAPTAALAAPPPPPPPVPATPAWPSPQGPPAEGPAAAFGRSPNAGGAVAEASDSDGGGWGSSAASSSSALASTSSSVLASPPPPAPLAASGGFAAEGSPAPASYPNGYDVYDRSPVSARAVSELLATGVGPAAGFEPAPTEWLPFGRGARAPRAIPVEVELEGWNIFTVNDPAASSQKAASAARSDGRVCDTLRAGATAGPAGRSSGGWGKTAASDRSFGSLLWNWSWPSARKLRSALDPGVRQGRREVRKWRQWHDVFRVLNDIERRLGDVTSLLVQAAASMWRFGESHGALRDGPLLSAFFRDAALYYRSEADVPKRLETHLGELERAADDFRSVSLEPGSAGTAADAGCDGTADEGAGGAEGGAGGQPIDLRQECDDLQLDVAVLLESALMTAQQAFAEYKKMHCRLELLATEYEPLCRLELDATARPVFLPLLADEQARAAAESLPEQAVEWALDFSQLVAAASTGLGCLVRELEHRTTQLKSCADELRCIMLRRSSGG